MRFASLYLADGTGAERAVRAVAVYAAGHFHDLGDVRRRGRFLFYHVRRECMVQAGLKNERLPAEASALEEGDVRLVGEMGEGMLRRWVDSLREPARSAAILFYIDVLDTSELEKVLGTDLTGLGLALRSARVHLARMLREGQRE